MKICLIDVHYVCLIDFLRWETCVEACWRLAICKQPSDISQLSPRSCTRPPVVSTWQIGGCRTSNHAENGAIPKVCVSKMRLIGEFYGYEI